MFQYFFAKINLKIDERHPQKIRHFDIINFLKNKKIEGSAILDVGCGDGQLASYLKKSFSNITVTGIDWVAQDLVAKGSEGIDEYLQEDLNEHGLRKISKKYNLIICSDVLEHLERPAFMLREFERVLTDNGKVIISIPNAFNIFERVKWLLFGNSARYRTEKRGEYGHISVFSSGILTSLLNRANLKVTDVGKAHAIQLRHIILPSLRFGRWLSFVEIFELSRKETVNEIQTP